MSRAIKGPNPLEGEGSQVNDKTEGRTGTTKRSSFSFWFSGGHSNSNTNDGCGGAKGTSTTNGKKEKSKRRSKDKEPEMSLLNDLTTIDCDLTRDEKLEALRRTKLRSASESSALDANSSCQLCPGEESPSTVTVVIDGKWRLNGKHHRQTSKSAVHLAETMPESPLEASEGNCAFDWWFHRRRRSSSKNKSR